MPLLTQNKKLVMLHQMMVQIQRNRTLKPEKMVEQFDAKQIPVKTEPNDAKSYVKNDETPKEC